MDARTCSFKIVLTEKSKGQLVDSNALQMREVIRHLLAVLTTSHELSIEVEQAPWEPDESYLFDPLGR